MSFKPKMSYQHDSDAQSQQTQETQENSTSTLTKIHTPTFFKPRKSARLSKSHIFNESSSEEQDWKTKFSNQLRQENSSQKQKAIEKKNNMKKKYPQQTKNYKSKPVQVKLKDKSNVKYEDLCSICLDTYSNIRGHLGCGHKFCYECIQQWMNTSTKCPCCREKFTEYVKVSVNEKNIQKKREIMLVEEKQMEFNEIDYYICYQCNQGDDQDVLLICDICQFYCCHVYCDLSLRNTFPNNDWYCKNCKQTLKISTNEQRNKPKKQTIKPSKKSILKLKQSQSEQSQPQSYLSKNKSDQEEQQTQSEQQKEQIQTRITRSKNMEWNFSTRPKTYQVVNYSKPIQKNIIPIEGSRVTNSTAANLRNLRRRRIS